MATNKGRTFVDVPGFVRLDNYGRSGDGVRFQATDSIAGFSDLFDTHNKAGGVVGTMFYLRSGDTIQLAGLPLEQAAEAMADAAADEYVDDETDDDSKG